MVNSAPSSAINSILSVRPLVAPRRPDAVDLPIIAPKAINSIEIARENAIMIKFPDRALERIRQSLPRRSWKPRFADSPNANAIGESKIN